jgi:glutathione S-transferase
MHYVELIAIFAVLQYVFFIERTGRARMKSGLKAPAIFGDESFERMYRVQMNTLELLVAFLPALFLTGKYWPPYLAVGLGVVYLAGRFIYWRMYLREPLKRGVGYMMSMFPTLILLFLAFVGVARSPIQSWLNATN